MSDHDYWIMLVMGGLILMGCARNRYGAVIGAVIFLGASFCNVIGIPKP